MRIDIVKRHGLSKEFIICILFTCDTMNLMRHASFDQTRGKTGRQEARLSHTIHLFLYSQSVIQYIVCSMFYVRVYAYVYDCLMMRALSTGLEKTTTAQKKGGRYDKFKCVHQFQLWPCRVLNNLKGKFIHCSHQSRAEKQNSRE